MAILRDGKQTIWNFKFNATNEDDFDTNLNKFFYFDENA